MLLVLPQAVIDNPDPQYLADRASLYAITPLEVALAAALESTMEDLTYYKREWENARQDPE